MLPPSKARPPGATSEYKYVLLADPNPSTRSEAEQAIRQAGCALPPAAARADAFAAGVFAATRSGFGDPAARAAIARLRASQLPVIPYGEDASGWSIAERAGILIDTGHLPLDSGSRDFRAVLASTIAEAVAETDRLHQERRHVVETMARLNVVGRSDHLVGVFRWVLRVSVLSDVPALIVGPTGTGKELVARSIHALDPKRSRGPFVPLNCAAISASLAESELFGHRRGAFTGADRDRPGLFRAAEGGVLFLDEIGELEAATQAKLLRTLQDGRILGVGSDRESPVSVRVVAATNRDIDAMVREGAFRADLFHRLNAVSIRLAPLSERPDDVAPLVEYLLAKYRGQAGCEIPAADLEFVDGVIRSGLPGNVRQVENFVRRAVVERNNPGALRLSDLPPELWTKLTAGCADRRASQPACDDTPAAADRTVDSLASATGWNLARALQACESLLVAAALAKTGGSQTRAARLLGITPRSMYNKLRRHNLAGVARDQRSA